MPEITARQICETALRLNGLAAAEQSIPADMAQSALDALNTMLDAWAVERLLTYTRPKHTLPLVPGLGTYTWGEASATLPVPDIPGPPPVRLELCLLTLPGSPEQEWPLDILDQTRYEAGVWDKTFMSAYPELVYLEASQPYAQLHVWPVPTTASLLQLFPWQASSPYAHWDHALPWPNGYARAFQYNLAVDLAPQYEREPSPTVARIAEESKRALSPVNAEVGSLALFPGRGVRVSHLTRFYGGRA